MADAVRVLRGLEELYPQVRYIERLRHCIEHYPDENWDDVMSRGQVRSKQWIIHQLARNNLTHLGDVAICGGWLGTLSRLILESPDVSAHRVTSLDLSQSATNVANELNSEYVREGLFRAMTVDCHYHDLRGYDTVINTSMEHFEDPDQWWNWVPKHALVVLQNNDYLEPEDHINTVADEWELRNYFTMERVIYSGTLKTHLYNRFMVIGMK